MLTHVPIAPLAPGRFKTILSAEQADALDATIARAETLLADRVVWNLNSTARGGGVAEMLSSLVAYARGAGVDARWSVIDAGPAFFDLTKRIHNRLHGAVGDGGPLGDAERALFEETSERNTRALARLVQEGDIVLCHDPQTAGLIAPLRDAGAHVVWRCHVGVDHPGDLAREAWQFLAPYVEPARAYVFSRKAFLWDVLGPDRAVVIPPSIDAFAPKNQDLTDREVAAILGHAGIAERTSDPPTFRRQDGTHGRVDRRADLGGGGVIPPTVPLLVQVSRWDRLKDHAGVLSAFCDGVPDASAHLALVGPDVKAVADDPEGLEVLEELNEQAARLPAGVRERVHLISLPMEDAEENAAIVNAVQRRATVIAQKSLAEGFGLTVAEAMWKARPIVASAVGGIRDQIDNGRNGLLVEPEDLDGFADHVSSLLEQPERRQSLGRAAQEAVRDNFLGPRHLTQYVDVFERLLAAP